MKGSTPAWQCVLCTAWMREPGEGVPVGHAAFMALQRLRMIACKSNKVLLFYSRDHRSRKGVTRETKTRAILSTKND